MGIKGDESAMGTVVMAHIYIKEFSYLKNTSLCVTQHQ